MHYLSLRKDLKDVVIYGDFEVLDPEGEESVALFQVR